MLDRDRQRRARLLAALESRAKQFRWREGSWPFRLPHEPLDLVELTGSAVAGETGGVRRGCDWRSARRGAVSSEF